MGIKNVTGYKVSLMAALLLLLNTVNGQAPRYSIDDPKLVASILDTVIAKRMERRNIPGFAISIVKDGKLVFSKGYGFSDLEIKTPVTADKTIFRIGSVTKVFTAVAMLQLVDEGKIKYNDDVNKYLNDKIIYKNNIPVTLHHLLSHSEGFREIPGRKTSSADKILPMNVFLKDRIVQDHASGEIGMYGTYGIALSGLLLENISGVPYREFIQKKIFDPLEMDRSNATDVLVENRKDLAVGYGFTNGKFRKMDFEYYHTYPASDINSPSNNMSNFLLMMLSDGKFKGRTVLKPESVRKMQSTQFRNDPRLVGYTYGLFESTINATRSYYHGGVMDGYASLMYLFPERNMGVFMACNVENQVFLGSILSNILYYFFPEPATPADNPDPKLKTNLERFVGTYQRPGNPRINISLNADSTLSFWGGKWLQVKPLLFRVINGTLDTGEDLIAFRENEKGEIVSMTTGQYVYFKLKN